jgi:hypothetical protein
LLTLNFPVSQRENRAQPPFLCAFRRSPTLAFIIAGFDLTQCGAQDITGGTCSPLDALGRLRDRPLSLHNLGTSQAIAGLHFHVHGIPLDNGFLAEVSQAPDKIGCRAHRK